MSEPSNDATPAPTFVVAGTDTGIGQTVFSAALVAALNIGVAYLYRDPFKCVLAARVDLPAPEGHKVTHAATA